MILEVPSSDQDPPVEGAESSFSKEEADSLSDSENSVDDSKNQQIDGIVLPEILFK